MTIAETVRATLRDAGQVVDPARDRSVRLAEQAWGAAMAEVVLPGGGRAVIDRAAVSLERAPQDVDRALGFGHHIGDAMAQHAGAPRAPVALLAAQLNLAIGFFDRICDRFPARLPLLLSRLDERGLEHLIAGKSAEPTGDLGVDVTVALFAAWFEGVARLDREVQGELHHAARRMHRAELAITNARRAKTEPTLGVLRALRAKSALPFLAMALPAGGDASVMRDVATAAGEAIWMVDDLADLADDLRDDVWSRPLWRLARARGPLPVEPAAVLDLLGGTDIVGDEARRLAARLARLRRSGAIALTEALRVGVDAWLGDD